MALRILSVAPTVGEKAVALKVGETGASRLNPLHAPGEGANPRLSVTISDNLFLFMGR